MKGFEFNVTKQNGMTLVQYQLGAADAYDERVSDKVAQLGNIIPFQYKDEDGKRSITSYVHDEPTLEVTLRRTLKKPEVLAIIKGLLCAFEIGAAGIQISYLVRDTNYIYVDPERFTVKCMMVPVKQGPLSQSDIPDFFRNIVSRMRFDDADKDNYVAQMLSLINTDNYSNLKLKELVDSQMESIGLFYTKEEGIRKNADTQSSDIQNKDVRVNRVGVMNNMRPQGMPQMSQGMPGQPQQRPQEMQPQGMPQMQPQGMPQQRPQGMQPQGMPQMQPQQRPQVPPQGMPVPPQMQPQGMPQGMPMQPQGMLQGMPQQRPQGMQPQGMPQGMPMQPQMRPQVPPQGMPPMQPQQRPQGMPPMQPQGMPPMQPQMRPQVPPQGMPGQPQGMPQAIPQPAPEAPKSAPEAPKPQPAPEAPKPQAIPQPTPQPAPEAPKPQAIPQPAPEAPKPQGQPQMRPQAAPEAPKPQPQPMPQPTPEAPKPQEQPQQRPQAAPQPMPPQMQKPAPEAPKPQGQPQMRPQAAPEAPKPQPQPMPQPTPDMADMPTGNLVGQLGTKPIPHFVRKKTGEIINITKPEFVIGKSKTKADYAIENNSAISREHCIVIQRDGVNYIKDNNSTNHTYVNGVELQPGKEVLLKHKTDIRMGDEEFTFLLRKGD